MHTTELDCTVQTIALADAAVGAGLRTVRLVPDGTVESRSGTFVVDAQAAQAIITEFEKHGTPLPIDFEHQTLGGEYSAPSGRAPAAGWVRKLFYESGRGLMGLVEWNQDGASAIRAKQYLFLSPVVVIRKEDRRAIGLHSAALTNKPAIPRMEALAASERLTQELAVMADQPKDMNLPELGEKLRAIADKLGLTASDVKPVDVLDAVLTRLEKDADNTDVAASARRALGLGDDASTAEVCVAIGSVARLRDSASELGQRELDLFLQPYIERGVLDLKTDHPDDIALIRELACSNRDAARRWLDMRAQVVLPPQGVTKPPSPSTMKRITVINKARSDFRYDQRHGKLTTCKAFVNDALRQAELATLTDSEVNELAIG